MGAAELGGAGAHADEAGVPAAAEDRRARDKSQLRCRLGGEAAHGVGGLHNFRKVRHVHVEESG